MTASDNAQSGSPRTFPVGLLLGNKRCLVAGDGPEQHARVESLLEVGARVVVVSANPDPQVEALAQQGSIELCRRAPTESDLSGVWLGVLVEQNEQLAVELGEAAEREHVLFCALDQLATGNFYHMARVRAGHLSLSISTNGKAPALARRLRLELERLFESAGLAEFVSELAALRERTAAAERRAVLTRAVAHVRFDGRLRLTKDR